MEWLEIQSQDAAAQAFPPPPSDDRGYDVRSYDLDIRLFIVGKSITGTIDIGLTALAAGTDRIRLDLVDEMTCDSVLFKGRETAFTHQGDSLVIDFPDPLGTDRPDTVTITWNGVPQRHGAYLTGLMFRTNENGTPGDPSDDTPTVANQNEPWSAHSWWPCKDHPSDKALVTMTVTVPDDMSMVSNGSLMWEDSPGPGLWRTSWREQYPIATYLVSVATTNYSSWSEDCRVAHGDPVRLDFHVFPHHREAAEVDLAPTCEMLELMTSLVGPYPFTGEKYAQAEIKWGGSMEHQTASSLSQIIFTGDRYFELVVIHELAHQWFGDSLTPAVWADIWLNEGFARYCEALWVEEAYGQETYRAYMREIGVERHPDLFVNDGVLIDPDPILPNTLIYDKGAWVLHMLRMWIGRPAFETFLANYATAPELMLGSVTTEDMIAYAEAAAGQDLSGFFDPWLETSEVPVISTNIVPIHSSGDGHAVKVTFEQHQTPVFEVAVPVTIHTACQDIQRVARLSQTATSFTWQTSCRVDSVSIDPAGMVLMRTTTAPPPVMQVVGPWPNPVPSAGAEFRIYLTSELQVSANLYDTRGRLAGKTDLGWLVATGAQEDPDTEPHVWTWPLSAGTARLPAGVYWAEFLADGGRVVRKFTLLN